MAKLPIKLKTDIAKEVFPRKLSKSELRQMQIIERSIGLCAKEGFEGLSYEKIGKACKVSRHLVIHYFPTRDEIVEQSVEYVWASLKRAILEALERETSAVARMEAYVISNLTWARENVEMARFFILFLQYASIKPVFRRLNTDLLRLGQERVLGILRMGLADGSFAPLANPELEAKSIQLTVLGYIVGFITEDGPFGLEELESGLCSSVIERLSAGRH